MSIRYAGVEERRKRLKRDMSRIFDVPALTRRLPLADQPVGIAVDMSMFAHQRRALGRMQAVEQNLVQRDIRLPGLHCDVRTRGGVLCDKVHLHDTSIAPPPSPLTTSICPFMYHTGRFREDSPRARSHLQQWQPPQPGLDA
jgi:hypothetical protein